MDTGASEKPSSVSPCLRGGRSSGRGAILRAFALVGQLGFTVAAGGIVGALAGHGLDRWLGTAPGFLIGGLVVGFAGGGFQAYRMIAGFLKE